MMQTSNGRAINVVKALRNRHTKDRASPYKNSDGTRRLQNVSRPDDASLSDDKVNRCLNAVELALRRSNREEAIASIERAFLVEESSAVTLDSHLEEINLRDRLVDILNVHHIYTIRDLVLVDIDSLKKLKGLKESDVDTIVRAVETQGFRFSGADDDE